MSKERSLYVRNCGVSTESSNWFLVGFGLLLLVFVLITTSLEQKINRGDVVNVNTDDNRTSVGKVVAIPYDTANITADGDIQLGSDEGTSFSSISGSFKLDRSVYLVVLEEDNQKALLLQSNRLTKK